MPVFLYQALDAKGNESKGQIEALSSKEAISKIRSKGMFPTKVRAQNAGKKAKVAKAATGPKRRGAGGRVKIKAVTQFARQMSTLQDAGLAILRSLRILEEQQKKGPLNGSSAMWPTISKAGPPCPRRWANIPAVLTGCL